MLIVGQKLESFEIMVIKFKALVSLSGGLGGRSNGRIDGIP